MCTLISHAKPKRILYARMLYLTKRGVLALALGKERNTVLLAYIGLQSSSVFFLPVFIMV